MLSKVKSKASLHSNSEIDHSKGNNKFEPLIACSSVEEEVTGASQEEFQDI
jgi:hypothetical protein